MSSQSWGIFNRGNYAGVDQGVDFSGAGDIPALGSGVVTYVGSSHIIEGGSYPVVIYRLTSGQFKGQYVYIAENFVPSVRIGDKLSLGKSIGKAKGSYPYIEIGFNNGPNGWNPVAPLGSNPHGPTSAGSQMLQFIDGLTGLQISSPPASSSGNGTGGIAGVPSAIASQAGCIIPVLLTLSGIGFLAYYFS